ncbi:MAG: transporter substrate-binding domain-containing protein [Sedimenticola sp.]
MSFYSGPNLFTITAIFRVAMRYLSIILSLLMVFGPLQAQAEPRPLMVLATVDTSSERINLISGRISAEKPGWFVELSRRAADRCGAEIDFAFMPWPRALEMVKDGKVEAAFNSSFLPERAVYGQYPMKDGQPDESRASKLYAYHAYVHRDSTDKQFRDEPDVNNRVLAVEPQASINPELVKRGGQLQEVDAYLQALRMAALRRVDAAVGIDHNFDPLLDRHPDLKAMIRKVGKPVHKKVGYVMFSKIYYAKNKELVECFWDQYAALRQTSWFKQMREAYR